MKEIEASGVSHTGEYYFKELDKVIQEIGPLSFSRITCDSTGNTRLARELIHKCYPTIIILADPCHQLQNAIKDICNLDYFKEYQPYMSDVLSFFSKSTIAATHFHSIRKRRGIKQSPETPGKTRFAGWHYTSKSLRCCLPAIEELVESNVIEIKKVRTADTSETVTHTGEFKKRVIQLEKLTEPFAKAIKCLESGHSNPSDVFIFYMAVMATLRQLVNNNETELSLLHNVITQAQKLACSRYYSMVLASGQEVYLATFFLHPRELFLLCIFRILKLTR
ncbi:hypothetical protein BDV93DRAFT_456824 [Ceratobasidium sp. AG-I]|nr:hypothetical protein BDV93DRAFT_456824 [Ceratobasidium sp. AG-I]